MLERRCDPEAAVKTVLCAEVHAQIFTIPSLQNLCDLIHGVPLMHCTVSPAWFAMVSHNAWYDCGLRAPTPRSSQSF